ncbi:late competence development ComFB family protein [Lysinibacillus sp. FSL R7-0073]|uniref:Competence protein ComFB n=1 Tax=Lysinibacillus fusiformis TaxID=28031 RepID=A0A1E4R0X9_9BACI|nr:MULTISPECIES: late competence development ComFB family protein [Lysinibacillus]MBD8523139.1 late competence development ComFB family protein [Lysinibacillus fusiformis]MED4889428.1 late competence development ComFB family protein [Lysinibacillus fusiformis]ODV54116.1 competence protein ComFB [Lysinibacillus fusiformis]WKT76142.1 late competence development ComFB family protein [Lysinibacillus fusiformis]WKT79757.1 late competence development ComFB family protein [Lysinibacillus fusiformis]
MNKSDPILVNVTEEIVRGLVSFLLRGPEYQTFCKCEICELDTVALTLNALPSKYVTSMEARDAAFKEMNTPESIERINKEIIHALHVVNKYPRHKVEPTS